MDPVVWLVIFIVMVVIEAVTLGFTTIWFAGGALAAFLISLLSHGMVAVEAAVFIIVSVMLLVFTRPWAMRYLNHKTVRTNADSLIGLSARVTEPVDNRLEQGAAQIEGKEWTARSADDDLTFDTGEMAVIQEIRGVKLILTKGKEDS